MSQLLRDVVDAINRLPKHPDHHEWGAGPADQSSINAAKESAREYLHIELADEYLLLARMYDRISLDGKWILSVRPQRNPLVPEAADQPEIVNKTLAMRQTGLFIPADNWVWYGWGELDYLVHNLSANRFELRVCEAWNDIVFSSAKFSEAVLEMFKARLPLFVRGER